MQTGVSRQIRHRCPYSSAFCVKRSAVTRGLGHLIRADEELQHNARHAIGGKPPDFMAGRSRHVRDHALGQGISLETASLRWALASRAPTSTAGTAVSTTARLYHQGKRTQYITKCSVAR